MEICNEYGFRAIYDRSPLRVHHNFPSIAIAILERDGAFIVLLDHSPPTFSLSISLSLSPLRFPIVARSTNGKIYRFYFWRASRVSRARGRGRGVCKYTYRKRGQAQDLKQSGVCDPAKRYTRKY